MHSMSSILPLLIIGIAHWVAAIAGFGSALLAVPMLLWLWGPDALSRIVFFVLCLGAVQGWWLCIKLRQHLPLAIALPIVGGSVVGLPIGMAIVDYLPKQLLMFALAGIIALSALHAWRQSYQASSDAGTDTDTNNSPTSTPSPTIRYLSPMVTAVGGVVHGAFGTGGSLLVAWTQKCIPKRDAFRATMATVWTALNTIFVIIACLTKPPAASDAPLIGAGIGIVILATWAGNRIAQYIEPRYFTRGVAVLLFVSSGSLILSSL